jgi:hypothetical protein
MIKDFADNYLKEKGYNGCDDFFSSADVPQDVVFDMMKAYALSVLPNPKFSLNKDTLSVDCVTGFNDCIDQTKKNIG